MSKTKIIATIGPSCEDKATFKKLVENGLSVARLNLSHGDHETIKQRIEMIDEVRNELNKPVAILMDTRGPEIRTRNFINGKVELKTGNTITLAYGEEDGDENRFCITYPTLHEDVKPGNIILIDDGLIELEVQSVDGPDITCLIKNGGIVKNRKGINVPDVNLQMPPLTPADEEDLVYGIGLGIDFVAASFIRSKADVDYIRELLANNGGADIHIISKIENQAGIDHIDEIMAASDGIMIARGDLGVETPPENIPLIQKMIIERCNKNGVPVITATQMLESMINNPRPTRAEVSDVANAIFDGTDVIMLSGETAAGAYPVESVRMMRSIAASAESQTGVSGIYKRALEYSAKNVTTAVSYAAVTTATQLDASAILCPTHSGRTARMISKLRPKMPIIATTVVPIVQRQMSMLWGVTPLLVKQETSSDLLFYKSVEEAKKAGLVNEGEHVVITAGVPVGQTGNTNLMKVQVVE